MADGNGTNGAQATMIEGPIEKAFSGKMASINLSTGEITVENFDDDFYRQHLGGYGVGARLALDRIPKGADPLGPDNMLGLFPGLLTGTPLFGQRWQAVCKSPLHGGWGDANCGGVFGAYLRHAGWDGLMFTGKADKPAYLEVLDDKLELKDASDLWGVDAITTEKTLIERYGKGSTAAVIGPASEKLSLISGICNDHGRLAARSGVGAVMGSKNLKAVAVKASQKITLGMPNRENDKQVRAILSLTKTGLNEFIKPLADFFHTYGTPGITAGSAHNGDSPVKNWAGVGVRDFPEVATLTGDEHNKKMDKTYGCWHCPLSCGAESHESDNPDYPYPKHTHRAEYETMASFGTMNLNNNLDSLTYANHLCNEYGFDVIGAGVTTSFAIECFENGILTKEDTGGLELRWGDDKAVIELLKLMGKREGIGDVLADGVKVAAERIGKGSEQYAMHVGGSELPMHDPRLQPEYYTTYKLDPTPARHTQYEGNRRMGVIPPPPGDRTVMEGRGEHHKGASEYMHVVNSAGFCQFVMMAANTAEIPTWINAATGWDTDVEEILRAGERIANLRLAFSLREGDNPLQRAVPERVTMPMEEGPHKDFNLDTGTLERDFLVACDWDVTTMMPSEAKLRELQLDDLIPVLQEAVPSAAR